MAVKRVTQGHITGMFQNQGVNPACPTLEPTLPKMEHSDQQQKETGLQAGNLAADTQLNPVLTL